MLIRPGICWRDTSPEHPLRKVRPGTHATRYSTNRMQPVMVESTLSERKRMWIGPIVTTACLCIFAPVCAGQEEKGDPVLREIATFGDLQAEAIADLRQYFQSRGMAMDRQGIREYFRPLDDPNRAAEKLIRQLGSNEFAERAAATRAFECQFQIPLELLNEASQSRDPEVATRAKSILKSAPPLRQQMMLNVMRAIELLEIPGLLPELCVAARTFSDDWEVLVAIEKAVVEAATQEDARALAALMTADTPDYLQIMAIKALRRLEPLELADSFVKWSEDTQRFWEIPRAESMMALADLGDRRAVGLLLDHMENADSATARSISKVALQKLTGQDFSFSAYAASDIRNKQITPWKQWFKGQGKTAQLRFPLRAVAPNDLDRCVAFPLGDQVILVDSRELDEVWSFRCDSPNHAEKMGNGNILVSTRDHILEVTPDRTVVRTLEVKGDKDGVLTARPLENGNILVARGSAFEVDKENNKVWELTLPGEYIENAMRIKENGHTLISLSSGDVAECDRSGKVIWKDNFFGSGKVGSIHLFEDRFVTSNGEGYGRLDDIKTKKILAQWSFGKNSEGVPLADGVTVVLSRGPRSSPVRKWYRFERIDGGRPSYQEVVAKTIPRCRFYGELYRPGRKTAPAPKP